MQQYRPNLGYNYPNKSDQHMLEVPHKVDTHFDENYKYYPKSFGYKIIRGFLWIGLYIAAFPLCRLLHGLKIHGRENIRKNRKLLKNGCITICNHVFMWDYLCVMCAIKPHLEFHMAWKTNFEGPNRNFIRLVGGIPIPTDNTRAMVRFSQAVDQVIKDGRWFHTFPEGSMWYYYPDIRPLKKGVFKYSVKHNKPVLPLAISFRERKGLYKLFGKTPCVDIHIGEPIMPDMELSRNEAIQKIQLESYIKMQNMVGLHKGDPTYNEDLDLDHYKKTM